MIERISGVDRDQLFGDPHMATVKLPSDEREGYQEKIKINYCGSTQDNSKSSLW